MIMDHVYEVILPNKFENLYTSFEYPNLKKSTTISKVRNQDISDTEPTQQFKRTSVSKLTHGGALASPRANPPFASPATPTG